MKMLLILAFVSILLTSCDEMKWYDLTKTDLVNAPDADFEVHDYFGDYEYHEFKVIFPVNGKWQVKPEKPDECNVYIWQKISSKSPDYDWFCLTGKKDSITGKSVYYNISFTKGTTYRFKFNDNNKYYTYQTVYFYKKNLDAPKYGILNKKDSLTVPKIKFDLGNPE